MHASAVPSTRTRLQARGLRPAAELAANRPHGDRLRYIGGCRCDACRKANTDYERERSQARAAGDWNGVVAAARARAHLKWLSKRGVGRRAVAAASDVAETTLSDIIRGKKTRIRARTERRILAITPAAVSDRALVDARPARKMIDALIAAGFTKTRIAKELGYKRPALQLGKHKITARNAYEVQKVHVRLIVSDDVLVDASRALSQILCLRDELMSAGQLARELELENSIEDGELRLPHKISRRLEKRIDAIYQRYMA